MKLKLDDFVSSTLRSLISSTTENGQKPSLWIFGYGSLIWNPGFEYDREAKARLRGYSRRFYMANTTYRGTVDQPGRVVTLVPDRQEDTYGLAFKVSGWQQLAAALDHLHVREIMSGYVFRVVQVQLTENGKSVPALTCMATEDNDLFLAPELSEEGEEECLEEMARQIANARGKGGPNHEYLSKLADSMRSLFPDTLDRHLFRLETLMLQFLDVDFVHAVVD
jgi:cation transport protein ChaC